MEAAFYAGKIRAVPCTGKKNQAITFRETESRSYLHTVIYICFYYVDFRSVAIYGYVLISLTNKDSEKVLYVLRRDSFINK